MTKAAKAPGGARGYEEFQGLAHEFTSQSTPWYPASHRAASTAPNIVVVLVDDLGFSDLGPYGSEIDTPNIDQIAGRGCVFTNYHTAPVCSPARAALLTGLNPHRVGFGAVAHVDPGYPGFNCQLPDAAPTLAESLRAGGYATFMVGKWHLTIESQMHDAGDRATWPLQRGFDRYYGSMDGFTSLHHPHRLVRDNAVVARTEFEDGYFLTDDLTNEAIGMVDDLRANDRSKPFFLYFAHTAVHGPVQAKAETIARFRGRYEAGWNALRDARFARQKATGIVPDHAVLPTGDAADDALVPEWSALSDAERELFTRHMEVYAASVHEVDESVGRLTRRLAQLGELDNTIIVIASDNGGTAEGGPTGTRSYFSQFVAGAQLPDNWVRDVPRDPELIGGPRVHGHYPTGWARVSNTPFRSFKGSVYEGGVHAPLIVSWPAAPEPLKGEGLRDQFVFVSDVAPTLLDLAGVSPLASRHGQPALEVDGKSFTPALATPQQPGRDKQYFEAFGARALVAGDWKAVSTKPPTSADGAAGGAWELYDLAVDPTETLDLAAAHEDRVHEMAEAWRSEAWRNTVFPLNDDGTLFLNRPESENALSLPVTLTPFRPPLERFRAAKLTVLRSFEVQARVTVTAETSGVIVAHGDQGGGYLLALEAGAPLLSYNAYGEMHRVRAARLAPGSHELSFRFTELDGLRWRVSLSARGEEVAALPEVPMLLGMSPFTGISVGYDYGGPVDWELHELHRSFPFTGGQIEQLTYVPGAKSRHDHTVIRRIGEAVAELAD
ncbi:arylsulfatase [Leucobacter sp. HY1910]